MQHRVNTYIETYGHQKEQRRNKPKHGPQDTKTRITMLTRRNVSINQSNSFLKVRLKQPQVKPHREDSDMISVI